MPLFSYNLNIPAGPNNPSNDQPLMQTNTNSINSIIGVDHFSFGTGNDGFHQQVHLKNEAAPGLGGADGVLFANLSSGNSWPIWQNAIGSTLLISFATNNGTNGFASLPGGMLIQWGSITGAPIANGAPVAFPQTFLVNPFSITLGPQSNSTNDKTISITTGSITTTGFTVSCSGTSSFQTLFWMAIGRII